MTIATKDYKGVLPFETWDEDRIKSIAIEGSNPHHYALLRRSAHITKTVFDKDGIRSVFGK